VQSGVVAVYVVEVPHQQHWRAMKQIDELIMLIPVILNLKGNLEMNLSARLGTAANVGELDKSEAQRMIISGNLLLLQVQATVVSFIATCVSFIIGLAVPNPVQLDTPHNSTSNNLTGPALPHLFAAYPSHPRPIPIKGDGPKSGIRECAFIF
jgi:solute carrier family 41